MPGQDVLKTIAKLPSTSSYTELLQTGLDLLKKDRFPTVFLVLSFLYMVNLVMQNLPKKNLMCWTFVNIC